jgi:hypothetical protein
VFPGAVVVDAKTVRGSIKIKYKNKKRVIKEMNKEGVKLGDAEIKQDELGRWFIIQPIMRNAQEHPVECIPNHENLSLKFTSIQESGQVSQGTVQKVWPSRWETSVRACQKQADQS